MFGDIVNSTFQETYYDGVLGQIFLITYMLLFYTAVQNVFITIVMEGYEKTRMLQKDQSRRKKQKNQTYFKRAITGETGFNRQETYKYYASQVTITPQRAFSFDKNKESDIFQMDYEEEDPQSQNQTQNQKNIKNSFKSIVDAAVSKEKRKKKLLVQDDDIAFEEEQLPEGSSGKDKKKNKIYFTGAYNFK